MMNKSTKIACSTLIGVFFLLSVITVGCKDKKKTEEAPVPASTEIKSKMTSDTIPIIDTGSGKELDPPKKPGVN